MSAELFIPCIGCAKYRIEDITTIERIALLSLQQGAAIVPVVATTTSYQREAYRKAPD
jgi:hypothetical protein